MSDFSFMEVYIKKTHNGDHVVIEASCPKTDKQYSRNQHKHLAAFFSSASVLIHTGWI